MMTGIEIVKAMKKMIRENKANIYKVTVSIAECEDDNKWDVYVNVWYNDRWGNDDFKCFSLDGSDEKKSATKGKRLATTIQNHGFKAKYIGIENC